MAIGLLEAQGLRATSSKNACYHKVTNLTIGISCSQTIGVSIVTSLQLDQKIKIKIKVSWEGKSPFSNYIGPWSSSFFDD